jgi:hypothetical protein
VTANSWVDIASAVKGAGCRALEIKLTLPFTSDYSSQITIPTKTDITIRGNGAVLDASQKGRFFSVTPGASLALHSLTLQNGSALQNGSCPDGGALHISKGGHTAVYDSTFSNGQAQNGTGGAIANFGDLVVGSSKFTRNQAAGNPPSSVVAGGGAVWNEGTTDINCSTFENNTALNQSGYVSQSKPELVD